MAGDAGGRGRRFEITETRGVCCWSRKRRTAGFTHRTERDWPQLRWGNLWRYLRGSLPLRLPGNAFDASIGVARQSLSESMSSVPPGSQPPLTRSLEPHSTRWAPRQERRELTVHTGTMVGARWMG